MIIFYRRHLLCAVKLTKDSSPYSKISNRSNNSETNNEVELKRIQSDKQKRKEDRGNIGASPGDSGMWSSTVWAYEKRRDDKQITKSSLHHHN